LNPAWSTRRSLILDALDKIWRQLPGDMPAAKADVKPDRDGEDK
jgi:hypothetical protein